MGEIPTSFITSINVEDGSSIEKRVTLGRVLLVGVFALAWKKNKKNSLALLVIGWNDGKFDQETIFQYTGDDAISKANNAKIKIQQLCR